MTQDEIIDMARQVGLEYNQKLCEVSTPFCDGVGVEELIAFSKLVAIKERVECAEIAWDNGAGKVAGAILARGEA